MPRHTGSKHRLVEHRTLEPAFKLVMLKGSAAGTSMAVTKDAAVANGDLLLACINVRSINNEAITPPTGWATIQETMYNAGGSHFITYYKIAENEGASWTWTWTTSASYNGFICAFTNIDVVRPFISSTTNDNIASSANSTATGLTPDTRGALVVTVHGNQNNRSYTAPTGMVEGADQGSGPSSALHYFAEPQKPIAVGNRVATLNSADPNGAQMVAFRPRRVGRPAYGG